MRSTAKAWLKDLKDAITGQRDLPKRTGEAGYGMVGAMMTIGLIGMAYTFNTTTMVNQMKFSAHIEVGQDFEALRNYVRGRFDCAQTKAMTPPACSSSVQANISLHQGDGAMFISGDTSSTSNKLGQYQLHAVCFGPSTTLTGKTVKVMARRVTPDGSLAKDPLTGATLDWQDLFAAVPLACGW